MLRFLYKMQRSEDCAPAFYLHNLRENTLRPDNNRVRPALICPQTEIFIFQQMRLSSTGRGGRAVGMTMTVNN